MDARREATLVRQIEKVKRDLVALGDLRPGSLSTQYNVCGTPGCRCKATPPEKHGPYYQVSFTRKGKSSTKFVKKKDLPEVRRQLKNYERMKLLLDRWIAGSISPRNCQRCGSERTRTETAGELGTVQIRYRRRISRVGHAIQSGREAADGPH